MIDLTFPTIIKKRINNHPTNAKIEVNELIANKNIASNCYNIVNIQKILKLMEEEIKYKKKSLKRIKSKQRIQQRIKKQKERRITRIK